jgi:uroporphyrinogen-III synthase
MTTRLYMPVIENGAAESETLFDGLDVEYHPVPVNRIVPTWDQDQRRETLAELEKTDWLFFTSANGVEQFFDMIKPQELPTTVRIACVGPNTASRLKEHGLHVAFMPNDFRGKGLAREFITSYGEETLVLMITRPLRMGSSLVDELRGAAFDVLESILYTTTPIPPVELDDIDFSDDDYFVFRSPSGVTSFCGKYQIPAGATAFAIGPTTEKRLRGCGHDHVITAENASRDHLLAAVKAKLETEEHGED